MQRIALIGSCVTRDVWQFMGKDPYPFLFISRTGFASIMSSPVPVPVSFDGLAWESGFDERCVVTDVGKTALDELAAFAPEVIILDLIDERFDILQVGGSFVSYSHAFQTCGLAARPWARAGRLIRRDTLEATALWRNAARRFVDHLRTTPALRQASVVLHRAPWVTREVAGADAPGSGGDAADHATGDPGTGDPETGAYETSATHQITFDRVVEVEGYGRLMQDYYDTFEKLMPECRVVEVPRHRQIGAAAHVWGSSPFHYILGYYEEFRLRMAGLGIQL